MRSIAPRRGKSNQKGSVLIEFALSSTVLLLMFFGIVDFSRLFYTSNVVANAACAATQYGALSPAHYGDFAGMQNAALQDAGNPAGMVVNATQFCACSIGGSQVPCPADCSGGGSAETYIQVTVSMPFTGTLSYPGVPQTIQVSTTSAVRVQ